MQYAQKIIVFVCLFAVAALGIFYYRHTNKNVVQQTPGGIAPKTILAFLGAPGSGKGTLAKQAVSKLNFMSLSTGDLCRAEVASGSEKGKMIAQCMGGGLIPDEVMTDMVDGWLSKNAGHAPILLDGYPRTKAQAEKLAQLLKNKFSDYAFSVVYLYVADEEEVVQRIAGRVVCELCKAVSNVAQLKDVNAPLCEKCGGNLIRREDDKEEVVRERLKTFAKNNDEIVAYYKGAGIPVHVLNVSHRSPEEIFHEFKQLVTGSAEEVAPHQEETAAAVQ